MVNHAVDNFCLTYDSSHSKMILCCEKMNLAHKTYAYRFRAYNILKTKYHYHCVQKEVMRFNMSIILVSTKFFTTAAEGSLYLQNSRFLIRKPLYLTLNQTVSQLVGYVNRKRLHKPNEIFSSE